MAWGEGGGGRGEGGRMVTGQIDTCITEQSSPFSNVVVA